MIRTLLRTIVILLILVALGAFFFGYKWGGGHLTTSKTERPVVDRPVGTNGSSPAIDTSRARETGAELGEKVAVGAAAAEHAVSDASLTAKIKSKMVLDDTLQSNRINVDTNGTVVTLTGTVDTPAQKSRALQLARETTGVTSVVDKLTVGRQ